MHLVNVKSWLCFPLLTGNTSFCLIGSVYVVNWQLVWLETPTNPTLRIVDIAEAVKVIKQKNKDIIVVVDNTFMSSYFQVCNNLLTLLYGNMCKILKDMFNRLGEGWDDEMLIKSFESLWARNKEGFSFKIS